MTDPRLETLAANVDKQGDDRYVRAATVLSRIDADDLAAGVIRIDTQAGPYSLAPRIFPTWDQLPIETKAFLIEQTNSWLMLLLGVTIRETEEGATHV